MPRKFSDGEISTFIDEHLAHRLTALLCVAKRNERPAFWQERGDVYCASIEGSFIMFRGLLEFIGLESYREGKEHDLRQRRRRKKTDVMLDNFGLTLAEPSDFDPHRRLVARVHDGISKATVHLTYEANEFFDSGRDYITAVNELLRVIRIRVYAPLGREIKLHPDLARLYEGPHNAKPDGRALPQRRRWL
jgi:hypothetical protein